MDIAVIGGSNGGYAAAADLTEQGHRIRFWRRDAAAFGSLATDRRLTLKDARGSRVVEIAVVTADLAAAVTGTDLVLMPLPATGQEGLVPQLVPHLRDGQVVFMPPGSFGTALFARAAAKAGLTAKPIYAETGTLPYLTRKHGPAEIAITTRATRLPTGLYPGKSDAAFATLQAAFPSVEKCVDALDGALMNAGPIIHPPLILMNAGPIQHFEFWDIHNEGTQPAIRSVTDALDAERIAIRVALGYPAPHFPLSDHYAPDGDEWMYGRRAHDGLVKSNDWRESLDLQQHRYMREDIGIGLALLVSVGEWAGVPCPVARGLLALGSAVVGEDFHASGRTLGTLGLSGLKPAELKRHLAEGTLAW